MTRILVHSICCSHRAATPLSRASIPSERPRQLPQSASTTPRRDGSFASFGQMTVCSSTVRGVCGSVRAEICFALRRTKSSGSILRLARASVRLCATQTSTVWLWNFFERRGDENALTQDAAISQKALQFSKSTNRRGSLCLSPADETSAVAVGHRRGDVENVNARGVFHEGYRVRGTLWASRYIRSRYEGERSVCAGDGVNEKSGTLCCRLEKRVSSRHLRSWGGADRCHGRRRHRCADPFVPYAERGAP